MKSFRLLLSSQHLFALFVGALLAAGIAEAAPIVPFKASIAITEMIQPMGVAPCYLSGHISGTGQATNLGKVTVVSTDCINPTDPSDPAPTAFSFVSHELILTAANGDQIKARYMGTLIIEGGVGVIASGYEFLSGTGRFSQVTGAGTVQGVEDMATGKGQVQITGTISY